MHYHTCGQYLDRGLTDVKIAMSRFRINYANLYYDCRITFTKIDYKYDFALNMY